MGHTLQPATTYSPHMKIQRVALACSLLLSSLAMATLPEPSLQTPEFDSAKSILTLPSLTIKGGNTIVKDVAVRILSAEVVSAGASTTTPDWLAGTWLGRGYQARGSSWSIEANATNGAFTIAYPSLNCAGRWDLVQSDTSLAVFNEVITTGTSNCIVNGRIVITRIDKNHVTFSYWRTTGELDSWSTLTKKL
jgi:hypothetical protein